MKKQIVLLLLLGLFTTAFQEKRSKTTVSIKGDEFYINGKPSYQGRYWRGNRIQGLLLNSRMVQGIFDDLNPETRERFVYPDTKKWDADRNTREFVDAMDDWNDDGFEFFYY
jgi:hypothetical protein